MPHPLTDTTMHAGAGASGFGARGNDVPGAREKGEALVRLSNAGRWVDGRWLVRHVDLSLHRGTIVTLIGPNGSGKSTTARMALGLVPLSSGAAWRAPRLVVGYVPQNLNIDWTLPLRVSRFMRLGTTLSATAMEEALERVGATQCLMQEMRHLSGGEFQRVLLARAIARKPDVLVLDEPMQGVDYAGQLALYELITRIRDDLMCGVLLISHDLHVVMAATDHVLCLNGHVCCEGTPSDVMGNPAYQALFGQKVPAHLAIYEHDHGLDEGTGERADHAG